MAQNQNHQQQQEQQQEQIIKQEVMRNIDEVQYKSSQTDSYLSTVDAELSDPDRNDESIETHDNNASTLSRSINSTPDHQIGGRRTRTRRRGLIPRCDGIYGEEGLERKKRQEKERQNRFEQLQKLNLYEEQRGQLPAL